jgi:hypothetical protein
MQTMNHVLVIQYYIERHSSVIVTFLDSMKAFDTVSHNGLKVKLYDLGITGKMWNLLDKMYSCHQPVLDNQH